MTPDHYLHTGQTRCYDQAGGLVPCPGSGQDAQHSPGRPWPESRFEARGPVVLDRLTGLYWTAKANAAGFPLTWAEALQHTADLAASQEHGYSDWRLPNRSELRSLISYQARKPALPLGHPFEDVFLGWYWTSTSAAINPAFAWYVHLEGGRMFFGHKSQSYLVWPVRGGGNGLLPATGQDNCYNAEGLVSSCMGSGQDGELRLGHPWPRPRFTAQEEVVRDRLTGLVWTRSADLAAGPVTWARALALARGHRAGGLDNWRLPTINELESLVDASQHTPALPEGHPFVNTADGYWSSTTSAFEPDWCMALYLNKGAVGVGQKAGRHFHLWLVCSDASILPEQ